MPEPDNRPSLVFMNVFNYHLADLREKESVTSEKVPELCLIFDFSVLSASSSLTVTKIIVLQCN